MTELEHTMGLIRVVVKAGPPRPGLVPQSGDWEHPGRWVRPEGEKTARGVSWTQEDERQADLATGMQGMFSPEDFLVGHNLEGHMVLRELDWLESDLVSWRGVLMGARDKAEGGVRKVIERRLTAVRGAQKLVGEAKQKARLRIPAENAKLFGRLASAGEERELTVAEELVVRDVSRQVPKQHLVGLMGIAMREAPNGGPLPEEMKTEGVVGGRYFPATGQIEVFREGLSQEVLIHEIGHAVHMGSASLIGPDNNAELVRLYDKAVETEEGFPSEYSKENVREFFAELYATYVQWPRKLRRRNPEMAELLDRVFQRVDKLSTEGLSSLDSWLTMIGKVLKEGDEGAISDPPNVGVFDPDLEDVEGPGELRKALPKPWRRIQVTGSKKPGYIKGTASQQRQLYTKLRGLQARGWGTLMSALAALPTFSLAQALTAARINFETWGRELRREGMPEALKLYEAGMRVGAAEVGMAFRPDVGDVDALNFLASQPGGIVPALRNFSEKQRVAAEETIRASFEEGPELFDLDRVVDRLQKRVGKETGQLRLLVRTETAKVVGMGRLAAWEDDPDRNKFDYHWIPTLDGRHKDVSKLFGENGPYTFEQVRNKWLNPVAMVRNRKTGKLERQDDSFNQRCTIARTPKRGAFEGLDE